MDIDLDPRRPCPTCGIVHARCAICHRTNITMALCRRCRVDPINADWNPRTLKRDRAELEGIAPAGDRIAELRERRARPVSLIRQQVLALLRDYQIREPRRPRGRRRYVVEWEWERRPLHVSEIAFLLGRSKQTIQEILDSVERNLVRPVLAHAAERSGQGPESPL